MSEKVIESYFEAVNTENWPLMATLWNPTGELKAVGFRPRIGRDSVLSYFADILAGYPEHVDTPTRIVTAGNTVLVEIDFVGRLASGVAVTFSAVDVFDLAEGRIERLSTWYDSHAVWKLVSNV